MMEPTSGASRSSGSRQASCRGQEGRPHDGQHDGPYDVLYWRPHASPHGSPHDRRHGRPERANAGRRGTALTVLAVLALACPSIASAESCPTPRLADLQRDNTAAAAYFASQHRDAAALGQASTQPPPQALRADALGARGDGETDDTAALQSALARGRPVWLSPRKVYRITRRLDLGDGAGLVSDGTATLLMAAGTEGFNNATALRSDEALYGPRGTGLRIAGKQVLLQDFFIVKDYEDERYVIGIDVRQAAQVQLLRLKLRGFSLAPGIVTVRSSQDVQIRGLLIHASCSASTQVPADVPSFQVTGISVDDSRVNEVGSRRLRIQNNVIANLRMVPLTPRGDQSDGINFAGVGTAQGSVIVGNRISGVDEGLDLWGEDIELLRNEVVASSVALKLIHGANHITVRDNLLRTGPGGRGIGVFSARPAEARRQVHDVLIAGNRVAAGAKRKVAVQVEEQGELPPLRVRVQDNRFDMPDCEASPLRCAAPGCSAANNVQHGPSGNRCERR